MAVVERPCHGVGLGWRRELADAIGDTLRVDFVEVLAEHCGLEPPRELMALSESGTPAVVHSVGLSLGSVEAPDPVRLRRLELLSEALHAPFASDHVAFARHGDVDSGVLLPLPRTREALDVITDNVRIAQASLPVPFAVENAAAPFQWPESELDEIDFVCELLDRTGCWLVLDVANLFANCVNFRWDVTRWLTHLPLDRVAYVHVAGGTWRDGRYNDTHAHDLDHGVLELLAELVGPAGPGVMLERDRRFDVGAISGELDQIGQVCERAIG